VHVSATFSYVYYGSTCVTFPAEAGAPSSYDVAVAECAAASDRGDVIFRPQGDRMETSLFRAAAAHKFAGEPPGHTLWIGLQRRGSVWRWSNGEPLRHSSTDWAPGEPQEGNGDCVVADQSLGYKWRVTGCLDVHSFLCMFRKPKCPPGYLYKSWVSSKVSAWLASLQSSCSRSPRSRARSASPATNARMPTEDTTPRWTCCEYLMVDHSCDFSSASSNRSFSTVSMADETCRLEGTRVASPRSEHQLKMLNKLHGMTGDNKITPYYVGMRFTNEIPVTEDT